MQLDQVASSLSSALSIVNTSVVQPLYAMAAMLPEGRRQEQQGTSRQQDQAQGRSHHDQRLSFVAQIQAIIAEATAPAPPLSPSFPDVASTGNGDVAAAEDANADAPASSPSQYSPAENDDDGNSTTSSSWGINTALLAEGVKRGARAVVAVHAVQRSARQAKAAVAGGCSQATGAAQLT